MTEIERINSKLNRKFWRNNLCGFWNDLRTLGKARLQNGRGLMLSRLYLNLSVTMPFFASLFTLDLNRTK